MKKGGVALLLILVLLFSIISVSFVSPESNETVGLVNNESNETEIEYINEEDGIYL